MIILTDIDDTILQFADGFQKWAIGKGYEMQGHVRDMPIETAIPCTRAEAEELIVEFSLSEDMANLEPEVCAVAVLPMLKEKGYEFVAISSCVNTDLVMDYRIRNIQKAFGFEFKEIHLVGLGESKENFLKHYDHAVWVEDNAKHSAVGASMGHRTFLLDRTYNRNFHNDAVTRVNDWHEIMRILE